MKSKKLRILALDMDDTLLRSDLSISQKTLSTIKQAIKEGAAIVLASSRIPETMERYTRLLGINKKPGYLICKNGALIMESNTHNIIHEAQLEVKTALAICDLAVAENFPVQIFEDNVMYVSRKNEYTGNDQSLAGIRQVVVENFRGMVAEGCHKLIIAGEPDILSHVKTIIENFMAADVTLFSSQPNFLEIMPQGTNKGSALAIIAGIMGISAADVMAIGHSMNDKAMIQWAGMGVALANADTHIAEAIEKNFIKGSLA